MKNTRRVLRSLCFGAAVLIVLVYPDYGRAQTAAGAQELSAGWAALAAGRSADADRQADAILRTTPRHHDALALKVAARVSAGDVNGALDAYERWLEAVRQREDPFTLERVAVGVVEAASASKEPRVRARALELLAALGNADAAAQLRTLSDAAEGAAADAALARLGDDAAIARLTARLKDPARGDVSTAIDALREANVKSANAAIAAALDSARPLPTKMAAARALGQLGGTSAIPRLRAALTDPDPPVRFIAAVSLAALGDSSGAEIVQSLEQNPIGDFRLLAVEARAASEPTGPWVGIATKVLDDPDPLVRLRAAELLLKHAADPGRARDVMREALADTNPAMRQAALDRLSSVPGEALDRDLPLLRKLLRDSFAPTRLEAAAAVLRISGALAP